MAQNLNEVQVKFVNEAVRPFIEYLISVRYRLDTFVKDVDNQQSAIASNTEVLNDGDGLNPRSDAPALTGQNIAQLRNFANNMLGQIDDVALAALIKLAVRDLNTIVKG